MPWSLEWYLLRYKNTWSIFTFFSLAQNAVIIFLNKFFGFELKVCFFWPFFCESQQCELSFKGCVWSSKVKKPIKSAPWVRNKMISCESSSQRKSTWGSNYISLSFELQVTHIFDSNNIVEVRTPFSLFCRYSPCYLPILKGFDFVSQMGPSSSVRIFPMPWLTLWFSNQDVLFFNNHSICHWIFWCCYFILYFVYRLPIILQGYNINFIASFYY